MQPHIYAIARIEGNRAHFDGVRSDEGTFSLPALHGRVQMEGTHLIFGNIQKVLGVDTLCVASAVLVDLPPMLRIAGSARNGMVEHTAGFKVGLPDGSFEGMVLAVFDGCLILQNSGAIAEVSKISDSPTLPAPVVPAVQTEPAPQPAAHPADQSPLWVSSLRLGSDFPVATDPLPLLNASEARGRNAVVHPARRPHPPVPPETDPERDTLIF